MSFCVRGNVISVWDVSLPIWISDSMWLVFHSSKRGRWIRTLLPIVFMARCRQTETLWQFSVHTCKSECLHAPPSPPPPSCGKHQNSMQVFMFTYRTHHFKFKKKKKKSGKRGACFPQCCVRLLLNALSHWPRSWAHQRAVRCEIGQARSLPGKCLDGGNERHTTRGAERDGGVAELLETAPRFPFFFFSWCSPSLELTYLN